MSPWVGPITGDDTVVWTPESISSVEWLYKVYQKDIPGDDTARGCRVRIAFPDALVVIVKV